MIQPPPQPDNSFRIVLNVASNGQRLDGLLLGELREQNRNQRLKDVTRSMLKKLFNEKRICLKGQPARPSSSLARGVSFVDILGFREES
jgi:predicted RNA binding protein with dsRBD fold (UPF0201 family)